MPCRETLKTWFRGHRRSSTSSVGSTDDESTRSSTDESVASTPRQKTKHSRFSPRTRRARSNDVDLRAMRDLIGCDSATQQELDISAAVAATEERRRTASKARRRFTIHGISHHRHDEVGWRQHSVSPSSPSLLSSMYESSPSHTRRFSLSRGKPMSLAPESHPSIIYIDCPP